MKQQMPHHSALLVVHASTERKARIAMDECVRLGLDGISFNPEVVTSELVEWLHARGKHVAVWAAEAPGHNDVEETWDSMASAGVDTFTSNLPPSIYKWRDGNVETD